MKLNISIAYLAMSCQLYATCGETFTGSHIWHCPDTGNATTNANDLVSFMNSKPFACGDRIILDGGITYRGDTSSGVLIPLKSQTGCSGKYTSIESSKLGEIPLGLKKGIENYRSKMATIEVATNAIFQLMDGTGTNNYVMRGIRGTSQAYTVANRFRIAALVFASQFQWTAENLNLYSPRNIELDRCLFEDYEQAIYGYPNTSNTDGNAFVRGISLGIDAPIQNLYVHDSAFILDGYTNSSGTGGTTDWITISGATATNPAVIQGTTLTTQLGITYNASCGACGGLDDPGACATACKRVVIRGATGSWLTLNGPRAVRARADGNVDVFVPSPDYVVGHTAFDASSFGAFTATSPTMASVAGLVQYAVSVGSTASSWRIIDNFIESWAMPVWLGGTDGPPIDPGTIQSGSTPTSLVLNHVRNLKVGMAISFAVPNGSGPSTYCILGNPGSGCYATDNFRVGRVTAITGTTATLEPWGVDGTDGITPSVGGEAIWDTWKIQGIEVRGNEISRGYLQSNASVGKGVAETKGCINCLFDGNAMGGYLDSTGTMRGNIGGTYFMESVSQGGKAPNFTHHNVRWSNNLGSGQLGSGSVSCAWANALIGNYVHFHSAITADRMFYEHNIATGCEAVSFTTLQHIKTLSGLDSHFKHNTFAPNMAQANSYSFTYNSECIPAGTETFPFFPEIGRNFNVGVQDNIIGYGDGPIVGAPNNATCWPTIAQDIQKNIIVDTQSVGTSVINAVFPNNFPVANYTSFWAGTCAFDSWTNCSLASGNPNRGAASDGGDPGADVLQIQDRLYRWSERAGLIQFDPLAVNMVPRLGNWTLGSVAAAVNFKLFNSAASACTVELFTNRNRSTRHADASTAQACNRASSVVDGNSVSYVFGGSSALTANTEYFYKITDGTRVMVGSFKTTADRGASTNLRYSYASARVGALCTNPGMSTGCTSYSSATTHDVTIPNGTIRYYSAGGIGVKALTW